MCLNYTTKNLRLKRFLSVKPHQYIRYHQRVNKIVKIATYYRRHVLWPLANSPDYGYNSFYNFVRGTMQTTRPKGRYLVGLDGLRAVAVSAVVLYHVAPHLLPGGFIGVDIFFVISGLLITTLLIEEHNKMGHIALRNFWVRRARRLLPALFATICAISSIAFFIGGDVLVGIGRQIIGAGTFSNNWLEIMAGTNYFDASSPHLFTNFWSLAVEEQFYLAWPFAVGLIMSARRFTKQPKAGVWLCGALAIGSGIAMALIYSRTNATRAYYGTDTHIFGLMIGAMMAFAARAKTIASLRMQAQPKHIAKRFGWVALGGLAVLMLVIGEQRSFTYKGGLQLASVLSAILVVSVITTRGRLHRFFVHPTLEWIGIRSYGIYLWHWPVLMLLRQILGPTTPAALIATLTCILTVLVAALSFTYLETPIRTLGLRAFVLRGIRHEVRAIDGVVTKKLQPHPIIGVACLAVILTIASITTAPAKTTAQLHIEAGERAIALAKRQGSLTELALSKERKLATRGDDQTQINGDNITVVGDSVALASAPILQQKFPGIYIDAAVSRSLGRDGFDTIANLRKTGNLRGIVVVALGTNGYYGTGNLEKFVDELGGRQIILVTSHAQRQWIPPNNDNIRRVAARHTNIRVAEWDSSIEPHNDELADGIHPGRAGATIYANSIAAAIGQFAH